MYNYMLTRFRARTVHHANSQHIKSIRDEIGITRMLLETLLNRLEDEADLVMMAGPIGNLVGQIKGLVESSHKTEKDMGMLMDRPQILQFADELIQSVREHVEDDGTIRLIADDILDIATRFTNDNEE
jgi:hypothetical protein